MMVERRCRAASINKFGQNGSFALPSIIKIICSLFV
jgi:hypothetical protein